jgi:hypothetical protein
MAANESSKSTGPKSLKGKARSSRNAVSHGLTAAQVLPDEVQMVESFALELTNYYKPESPLEALQIQRIAFCRAKLAKFMDIEVAGRELARRDLDRHPGKLIDQLTQYPQEARFIALKLIQGQSCLPGFKLSDRSLKEIAEEIEGSFGIIRSEDDLPVVLPKLHKYRASVKISKDDSLVLGADQKLMILATRIRQLFELDMPLPGKEGAFERALMAVARDEAIERQAQRVRAQRGGDAGYHKALEPDLQAIVHFWRMSEFSKMVIASYDDLKRWSVRALDISSEDADRMMKYQSMLERRISTAIGELLELQKLRK